ncbi:MAG TPA: MFS transporter [Lentimicrobium sp.]|nr:MFS transporter [Lentimicrobium sp.]
MKKYPTLLSLYLAQSIPMSFFSTIVPVIMRQEKYSLAMIGLLQLIKLPWIFKFLWAPVIDRYTSSEASYKRWIFSSELAYAIIIISIGFFNLQFNFMLIVAMMMLAFIASGTQDIATDAFAIKILRKEERSLGNSMQSSGSFLGTMTGSGVMLVLYHFFGWQGMMYCLAAFVMVALIPLYFYKHKDAKNHIIGEPEIAAAEQNNDNYTGIGRGHDLTIKKASFKDIGLFFKQKGIAKRIVLLFFFYSGIIGILSLMKPFLVDHGFTIKQIGILSGICGTASGALSALLGGYLIKKYGRKTCLYLFASFSLLVTLWFVFMLQTGMTYMQLYTAVVLLWMSYGMSSVAIYTISMDIVRKGREGTDFTIQIVITHISALLITILSGKLADMIGFSGLFIVESVMAALVLAFLPFLYREKLSENSENESLVKELDDDQQMIVHDTGS